MKIPKVTIVVSPHERFSYTRESLLSIYENTQTPFQLVYVDGNSPPDVHEFLQQQAQTKGFELIRTDYYLAPNQARSLGLSQVNTEYVVFIDNDVVVAPGWLEQLLQCAAETQATVVTPLVCIGPPPHEKIHLAGGEAHIEVEALPSGHGVKRRLYEKHYFVNRPIVEVSDQLQRKQCEFAEFHCMLVRTEIFHRIGSFDQELLNTREHIDFCMSVTQARGTIYCEPAAVVTYIPGALAWSDLPFFMLRWSDAWELHSLKYFRHKWDLTEDRYYHKRYNRLGHRRYQAYVKPFVRQLALGQFNTSLEQFLVRLDRWLNRHVTSHYNRRQSDVEIGA